MKKICYLFLFLLLAPNLYAAYWSIKEYNDSGSGLTFSVAHIENDQGYTVEIYKDQADAIRLRFSGSNQFGLLSTEYCPSFQVDDFKIFNRSINDAKCIQHENWAEFVLGYLVDGYIDSTALYRVQNGSTLAFRMMFVNGGYHETDFTLAGSSRVLLSALGTDVMIRKDR